MAALITLAAASLAVVRPVERLQ